MGQSPEMYHVTIPGLPSVLMSAECAPARPNGFWTETSIAAATYIAHPKELADPD